MADHLADDHADDAPAIRNLSGRWVMDASTSSDRAALMEALGVGGFARFLMGNVVTTLQVEHSRTRLMIETIASMGTLTETHLLDGIVREKANSGEQVLVKAWEEEDEAVLVETAWQKRALTSVDRRELVSRTRMKQVSSELLSNGAASLLLPAVTPTGWSIARRSSQPLPLPLLLPPPLPLMMILMVRMRMLPTVSLADHPRSQGGRIQA